MKKMLSTTLVAIAFAMVSTVDAKVMARKGAAPQSQKINNIATASADVVDMPAVEVQMPTEVQKALSAENLTEDEREYAVLMFQLEDTNKRIAFRQEQLKDLKLGMFSFITASKEQKEESNRITNIINKLKADKKQIEADMAALKPVVGSKFEKAMKLALLGVSAYIAASIVNKYFGGKPYTYASEQIGKGAAYVKSTRVGQAASNASNYATTQAGKVRAAAASKYNQYMGK
jgi:hypothetical protein